MRRAAHGGEGRTFQKFRQHLCTALQGFLLDAFCDGDNWHSPWIVWGKLFKDTSDELCRDCTDKQLGTFCSLRQVSRIVYISGYLNPRQEFVILSLFTLFFDIVREVAPYLDAAALGMQQKSQCRSPGAVADNGYSIPWFPPERGEILPTWVFAPKGRKQPRRIIALLQKEFTIPSQDGIDSIIAPTYRVSQFQYRFFSRGTHPSLPRVDMSEKAC